MTRIPSPPDHWRPAPPPNPTEEPAEEFARIFSVAVQAKIDLEIAASNASTTIDRARTLDRRHRISTPVVAGLPVNIAEALAAASGWERVLGDRSDGWTWRPAPKVTDLDAAAERARSADVRASLKAFSAQVIADCTSVEDPLTKSPA